MAMTSAPEPDDLPLSDLPRDPADYAQRRPGLPVSFWFMIVFGFVCIAAGTVVGLFGARLFAPRPAAEPPAAIGQAGDVSPGVPTAGAAPVYPGADVTTPGAPPPPAQISALSQRFDGLAADQRRTATAAGEALAAAELSEASQSSRPFADQLAALDRILPDSSALRALRPLAALQTPSRTALAADFVDQADHVAVVSRAAPKGAGLVAQISHALAGVFAIRRVDKLTGNSPDAVLARAQRQVDDGDLEAALVTLNALPPQGLKAIGPWRARAAQRVEVDRLVAAIRASAAEDLAQVSGRGPAT
jgi:hypothetical protein